MKETLKIIALIAIWFLLIFLAAHVWQFVSFTHQ